MTGTLVLVRHGQSEWNELNLFTGWKDPDLTKLGEEQAVNAGKAIKDTGIVFDVVFTSLLIRAERTRQFIIDELGQSELETVRDQALNERNYGELSGLNKDDARKKWGDEQVHIWRRSYDTPPPGDDGESLKDTGARVWPYYMKAILPRVLNGQKVLVAAHGNSLRALMMVLDDIPEDDISELELGTGVPVVYEFNSDSTVKSKKILKSS